MNPQQLEELISKCLQKYTDQLGVPDYEFPKINDCGLPTMLMGLLGSTMAGVTYVLKYIPPSIDNLPKIPTPKELLNIFISPFLASATGLAMGNADLNAMFGDIIPISGTIVAGNVDTTEITDKAGVDPVDITGQFKLVASFILIPYNIFKTILTGIMSLQLPTLSLAWVTSMVQPAFAGLMNIELPSLDIDIAGYITSFINMIKALIIAIPLMLLEFLKELLPI